MALPTMALCLKQIRQFPYIGIPTAELTTIIQLTVVQPLQRAMAATTTSYCRRKTWYAQQQEQQQYQDRSHLFLH